MPRPVKLGSSDRSAMALRQLEVRVLDDAEGVAEGILEDRDANPLADLLGRAHRGGARRDEPLVRGSGVVDAPVGDRAAEPLLPGFGRGQAEVGAAALEPDAERLVA